jgi:hypothetical protein
VTAAESISPDICPKYAADHSIEDQCHFQGPQKGVLLSESSSHLSFLNMKINFFKTTNHLRSIAAHHFSEVQEQAVVITVHVTTQLESKQGHQ